MLFFRLMKLALRVIAKRPIADGMTYDEAADALDTRASEHNAQTGENLDWRQSVVDLMKLLGMDSSLASRQGLAKELDYPNALSTAGRHTAAMNQWLHAEIMRRFQQDDLDDLDDLEQPGC